MTATASGKRRDAVVVGAGIAGLTAACYLALGGRRVVLLEAGDRTGGLCRGVSAEGRTWDLSLYGLRGAEEGGAFAGILEELGIREALPMRHAPRACVIRVGEDEFPFGTGTDEMLEAADRIAHGGADRLAPLLRRIRTFDPVRGYGSLARATFAEAAAGLGGRLLAAFGAPLLVGLGVPPERASAYFAFLKYRLLLTGGIFRPEGGADALVRALEGRFLSAGGTLHLGTRVEAVSPGAGSSWTVSAGGRTWRGEELVLAMDATTALSWLAPVLPPGADARGRGLLPALSATVLLCAVPGSLLGRLGLGRAPQAILVGAEDLSGHYRRVRAGGDVSGGDVVGLASPAAWGDPIPEGEQPLAVFFLSPPHVPGGNDGACIPADRLRAALGGASPVRLVETWTPRDFAGRTGNRGGAFCGWEMGPERYGRARIPRKLPLPGVRFAGHWTDPGPSVLNAALSGRAAARGTLEEG